MKKASKLFILAVCLLALVLAVTLVACDKGGQSIHTDHTASGDWQSDESGHWHICDEGGEKTDVAAHDLIAQEQDGKHYFKCEVCNYTTKPEAHTPSEAYASDGTYHWQECSVCHLPVNKQVHNPSGEVENIGIGHRFKCEVCQKTIEGAHAFDEENPASDEQNHWLECLFCDATTQPEAHTLGEYIIEGNEHSQKCEDCGATVNKAEHKANYALGYFADNSGHWYECECGQKMEFAAHEKNEASYTSNESEHWYSCKICLYQIEAEAHTLGEYISDGTKHYKQCEVCQRKALVEDCVPGEQHISENGEEYHNCVTCGKKVAASADEFYEMDEADHWRACPVCKKQLGDKVAHTGFTKYEFSIEGHWYVCDGCHNRVLSEHKYQDEVCTECNYFDGLEFWTFAEQSDGSWYVTSYTGTQKVVKMPTRDADGHTITGFARGTFSNQLETNPHNDYIEEVYLPEGYTVLPSFSFKYCASLKKVHFPTTLWNFGIQAFKNAPLEDVYIEDLAEFISYKGLPNYTTSPSDLPFVSHGDESNTFAHPLNLYVKGQLVKDMVVPEGVTAIAQGLLANNCFGLDSITLPGTLTSFSTLSVTFYSKNYGTDNLTTIDVIRWIPKIIISDVDNWFENCTIDEVSALDVSSQLNESDIVFMKDGEIVTDIVLPDGTTYLGQYKFLTSKNISSVTMNEQLKTINEYAFRNCENLHAVRNMGNTQISMIRIGTFNNLPIDEPLSFPVTLTTFSCPGNISVPLYFAKGSNVSFQSMSGYEGNVMVLDDFSVQISSFANVPIKEIYFYSETGYARFIRSYENSSQPSYVILNKPLYDAEVFFYSEASPEDVDSQNTKWHWNAQGEIEFWTQTNYADLVTIERNDDFYRGTYYHDIINDGDEYTYRLKATSKSGKEIEWTSLTDGAMVTQDGDVTATKIGFYKIKAAIKDNPSIYSVITVMFYPSVFYYSGTLGGQTVLENVDKNAGNLGDKADLKFYDDGTHKTFKLYVNAAKNDEFNIGFLGSDVKLTTDDINARLSTTYAKYLVINSAKTFKLRNDTLLTITINILDDNSLEVILSDASSRGSYSLMVKGRTWPNLDVLATAYVNITGNYGTTFTASVKYSATIDDWFNICFARSKSGNSSTYVYDQEYSSVYVFGEAFSMQKEPHKWCSSGHNDMHLWYESVKDESNYGSWEFIFTVRADGEILSVEINFAKDAEE